MSKPVKELPTIDLDRQQLTDLLKSYTYELNELMVKPNSAWRFEQIAMALAKFVYEHRHQLSLEDKVPFSDPNEVTE